MFEVLAVIAVVLAVASSLTEIKEVGGKAEVVSKWIKGHALNIAVGVDIALSEKEEMKKAFEEWDFSHIPLWFWAVAALLAISFYARQSKMRKAALIAALGVTAVESL